MVPCPGFWASFRWDARILPGRLGTGQLESLVAALHDLDDTSETEHVDFLRRAGRLLSEDDTYRGEAESCWSELLALRPDDLEAQQALYIATAVVEPVDTPTLIEESGISSEPKRTITRPLPVVDVEPDEDGTAVPSDEIDVSDALTLEITNNGEVTPDALGGRF